MLGIHRARMLPRVASETFAEWFEREAVKRGGRGDGREVVLLADTFTNYFEPDVGKAAAEVLWAGGFKVVIPPEDICCGRPLYDQGMLRRAKRKLVHAMTVLRPFVDRGVPIVGLEPSCILTFRDELPSLFSQDPLAQPFPRAVFTFDELVEAYPDKLAALKLPARALVHGHCHHKSLVGMEHETAVLGRVEGLEFNVLDSGCCGMAGAFGYEDEHFEISRKIGERVLLPAARESAPDTVIIADGFSCRAQIRQFCKGRRPLHLAQVLRMALASGGDGANRPG
jgi:Fe-S oxidoreductase